jgi:hypothetical protein
MAVRVTMRRVALPSKLHECGVDMLVLRSLLLALPITAVLGSQQALCETVDVKYRGAVNLASFSCSDVERSSFIKRVSIPAISIC